MKIKLNIKKLNERGASHIILPAFIVLAIAIAGFYSFQTLNKTKLTGGTIAPLIAYATCGALFTDCSGSDIKLTTTDGKTITTLAQSVPATNGVGATYLGNPVYSPNHRYIAYSEYINGGATGLIGIKDLSSPTAATRIIKMPTNMSVGNNASIADPVWSPDGNRLLFIGTTASLAGGFTFEFVSLDITAISPVPVVVSSGINAQSVSDYVFTPDGKYIVYTDDTGVHSVAPGSAPFLMFAARLCTDLSTISTTTQSVVYDCMAATNSNTKVYKGTANKTAKTLVHTFVSNNKVGLTSQAINRMVASPDGTKLGVLTVNYTPTVLATCTTNITYSIGTMPIVGSATFTAAHSSANQVRSGCNGGGDPHSTRLAWGPLSDTIAYVAPWPSIDTGSLHIVSLSSALSDSTIVTAPANLPGGNVGGVGTISW